ncbi:hypothetical protein Poli38472_006521 [Pythium oligandrum]|uniref:Thioredoxin domain-containing protein n=1 Tax=Pythium oligandrum TaxID=41045 RepID=A0A8K1C4R4_PYTOL|nr:hypothetical protein Poli38472_006521 [Pythium oligandrum]|eukprot:TMW56511.1 hypothetical protein Poli38472_006521 [Pythium oligandrum]
MEAILENQKLLTKSGELVTIADALAQKKIIGVYFSGHYCPPCRVLTPVMVKLYEEIKAENDDFEIIFASSDKEIEKFDEYFEEMPWLALPWTETRELVPALRVKFGATYIPTLIFFNDKGEIIERLGRELIEQHPTDKDAILTALRK